MSDYEYLQAFTVDVSNVEEWLRAMAEVLPEEWPPSEYRGQHRSTES